MTIYASESDGRGDAPVEASRKTSLSAEARFVLFLALQSADNGRDTAFSAPTVGRPGILPTPHPYRNAIE